MHERQSRRLRRTPGATAVALLGLVVGGCEQDREVLDVEAPGVDVEVREDPDTGELTIDGQFGGGQESSSEEQP